MALGRQARGRELSVLVVGAARSRRLNRRYRDRDNPTNVLSFAPAAPGPLLGDLVVCPAVLQREARAGLAVRHPHLVRIITAHVTRPPWFLVMEWQKPS